MRAKNRTERVNIDYTPAEKLTLIRRAKAAGLSMHKYVVAMTIDGKCPKRK